MTKDEHGYIVVETIGAFLLFTLLIVAILSLINIVTIQARIHFAVTQACETISMYSYVLDLTGAAEHIQNIAGKAEVAQGQIDEFKSNVNALMDGIENLDPEQIGEKGEAVVNQVYTGVGNTLSDPKEMLQHVLTYGLNEAGGAAFELLVRPLVGRYLSNGEINGDQYLQNYGVEGGLYGLDFYTSDTMDFHSIGANDSQLLTSSGDIKIVVQYDVNYKFGALPLPFKEPKLHVTQEVVTKAWFGEGEGYKG